MLEVILQIDKQITTFIFSVIPHNAFFDAVFSFLSAIGGSIILWVLIIGVLIFFEETRDKRFVLYFTISLVITVVLVNIVLKNSIKRPRPEVHQNIASSYVCPVDYGFPSGHA